MIYTFVLVEGQNIFSTDLFRPMRQVLLSPLILKMKEFRLGGLKEHD